MSLKGKIALVTGGSRGIGAGIALSLAKEGANIVITYVSSADAAQKVADDAKTYGVQAIAIKNDISDLASHQNLVDQIVKQFGHIDILVNNAGIFAHSSWTSVTAEDFDKIFTLNVKAPLFLIQKAFPHIPSGGSIINIGSAAVKANASVPAVVYLSSKFAVAAYASLMAKDLAEKGIRINTVSPGFTDTDMLADPNFRTFGASQSVFKRLGTNEDIANIVTFLADSKKSGWITGQQIDASGGVSLQF